MKRLVEVARSFDSPLVVILFALLILPMSALGQTGPKIVDLTHPFDETTIYWPTEEGFKLLRGKAGVTEGGYYYVANRFMCAEHGGTHIDAPVHFFEKGQTVEKIPLKRLVG